eukprot:4387645-Ditylum_brightwellii.AAC.1
MEHTQREADGCSKDVVEERKPQEAEGGSLGKWKCWFFNPLLHHVDLCEGPLDDVPVIINDGILHPIQDELDIIGKVRPGWETQYIRFQPDCSCIMRVWAANLKNRTNLDVRIKVKTRRCIFHQTDATHQSRLEQADVPHLWA